MVHAGARARRPLGAIAFRPPRALGVIIGGGFAVWALVVAVVAMLAGVGANAELKTFLAWAVAAVALILGAALVVVAYHVLFYVVLPPSLTSAWLMSPFGVFVNGPGAVHLLFNNAGVAAGASGAAAPAGAPAGGNYVMGVAYASLPPGCISPNVHGTTYFLCGNTWFQPSYGANGVFYRVVPTP